MDNNYDSLKKLFENLKNIGFWGRNFRWKQIKNMVIEAAGDLQRLQMNNENLIAENTQLGNSNSGFIKDLQLAKDDAIRKEMLSGQQVLKLQELEANYSGVNKNFTIAGTELTRSNDRIKELNSDNKSLKEKNEELSSKNTEFNLAEETRKQEHLTHSSNLLKIQERIEAERAQEIDDKHQAELLRYENLKRTWSNHEESTKQYIRSLCNKHTIQYIDKVPFKGIPDNTVQICGEYIIFDAKSPSGEDLDHFPDYIKEQTEKARKYAKEENVKKWIFFVVPSNTLEVLKTFVYPMADFEVFVITQDALEPILLSLKKIEEYEFAEILDPEDRDNICRVLGRFAHLSKRRIQIDTYFISQAMELAYKSESDLPKDILEKVMEFERADRLNPPQEKRSKAISIKDLEKSTDKLRTDMISKGILVQDDKISSGLNELPLYDNGSK